ncbi:MAG TPA: Fic family protein [Agriterribacter sp.]|nr:Fic family protein [Agriterribacter sp.]
MQQVKAREWTAENFKFATAVSVMSSSKIEGETLEVDSYVKYKMLDIEYLPNLTEKPNDLYAAYEFARDNKLTKSHFLESHAIATRHLLPENQRGVIRKGNMLIMEQQTQRIEYEAASAGVVQMEFDTFWKELDELLQSDLQIEEVFYYAALAHLVLVKIHPFNDGNGRTVRLLEKWFLAARLGEKAWYIPCELYYYNNLKAYYHNLARVGLLYEQLKYEKGIPFLLMLPQSLVFEK